MRATTTIVSEEPDFIPNLLLVRGNNHRGHAPRASSSPGLGTTPLRLVEDGQALLPQASRCAASHGFHPSLAGHHQDHPKLHLRSSPAAKIILILTAPKLRATAHHHCRDGVGASIKCRTKPGYLYSGVTPLSASQWHILKPTSLVENKVLVTVPEGL